MFCPQCGSEIAQGARFCPVCGAPVQVASTGVAAPLAQADVPPAHGIPRRAILTGVALTGAALASVAVAYAATDGFGGLLDNIFGGGDGNDIAMANASIGGGTAASAKGYDYYWDMDQQALMRAKVGSSSSPEKILSQLYQYGNAGNICADGDTVYLTMGDYSLKQGQALYRVNGDGGNLSEVFRPDTDGFGALSNIYNVTLLNGRLYVFVSTGKDDEEVYRVYLVDPSGKTDTEVLCELDRDSAESDFSQVQGPFAISEKGLYFFDGKELKLASFDSAAIDTVYTCEYANCSAPVAYQGKLYVYDSDGEGGGSLVSMEQPYGGDPEELYRSPGDRAMRLRAIADGKAYFTVSDVLEDELSSLRTVGVWGISLATRTEEIEIDINADNANLFVANGGDHLVFVEAANDGIGGAYGVYPVAFDGERMGDYMAYPYAS